MLRGGYVSAALLSATLIAGAPALTLASTEQLAPSIEEKLDDEEFRLVTVSANPDGVVTLSGTVPSLWHKERAIDRTRSVDGVQSVVSNLTIVEGESDAVVGREVARRIRNYVFYTIFDNVDISVDDGGVTLTGYVTEGYRVREIGQRAARATGVQAVDNRIEVLPASIFDSQLRTELAVRIYNHPLFSHLAGHPNPPVHIVVKNSRVTLAGVVNSETQRKMAEHIALSTFGVLGVTNELKLDRDVT